ncbi:MAG: hypothetical protein ACRD1C_00080 [Terriglobales bacterium]
MRGNDLQPEAARFISSSLEQREHHQSGTATSCWSRSPATDARYTKSGTALN